MDETEQYLNSILQKRMGSVINTFSVNEKATVTRLMQKDEKMEAMPTVFRKKTETILQSQSNRSQPISQPESVYLSKEITKPPLREKPQPEKVEYMAISKRLESKQEGEFTSATVDVTKFAKGNISEPIKRKDVISATVREPKNYDEEPRVEQTSMPRRKRIFE